MKIRVERDTLADAVAWAARVLPQKTQLPVLAGLRLDAGTDGALRLSGFDYEVSAEAQLDVTVAEAGAVLVPGRLLADITRSLPGQPVDVATDGTRVQLTCGTARFTLPTLRPSRAVAVIAGKRHVIRRPNELIGFITACRLFRMLFRVKCKTK